MEKKENEEMRKKVYCVMMMGLLAGLLAGCGDGKTDAAYAKKTVAESDTTEEKGTTGEVTVAEKMITTEDVKRTEQTDTDKKETETTESDNSVKNTKQETTQTREATEKETKTTEKKKPKKGKDKKTTKKTTEEKTTETTTEAVQSNKEIAKGYVGKTLDSLIAAIGSYSSFSKAESCYYEGEYDGIAQFDGFTVYCHSQGQTTWYIDSVE